MRRVLQLGFTVAIAVSISMLLFGNFPVPSSWTSHQSVTEQEAETFVDRLLSQPPVQQTYQTLIATFPAAADVMRRDWIDHMVSGGQPDGLNIFATTHQIFSENPEAVRAASTDDLVSTLRHYASLFETYADRPDLCSFIVQGNVSVLPEEDYVSYSEWSYRLASLGLLTIRSGLDRQVRRDPPDEDDFTSFFASLSGDSASSSYLGIAMENDTDDPRFCSAIAFYFSSLASAQVEGIDRFRAFEVEGLLLSDLQ